MQCFALSWECSTLLAEGYTAGTLSLTNAVGSLRGTNQVPTASGLCPADPLSLGALLDRSMSLVAGFPGFGTHATDLTALDQLIEQAAVRIQRAFRHFSRQRSKCLGSTVARPQPLTVYIQPEDEGDLDSKVDSSVADTEASQAST